MADPASPLADGLSGHSVRGAVESQSADTLTNIGDTVHQAAEFIKKAVDLTGEALGKAVDYASDKAFQSAAYVPQTGVEQPSFSWSGYFQALGALCILLAALWFAVWAIRKYGRFNFMPRPGAMSKTDLFMEAQMPLGPRKGLMVVNFMGRHLLLGVTDQQISYITEEKARENDEQNKTFQGYMDAAAGNHRSPGDTA